MNNFIQDGQSLDLVAPAGGVVSGAVYKIGVLIAVAGITAAAGELFPGWTEGVYDLPAQTGTAWAQGDLVYWDDTAKIFTKTVGSNSKAGIAAIAKASATATGRVKLIPTI